MKQAQDRADPDDRRAAGAGSSRPLKILFATARYLPESGGTEIHTHEVAKRLSARGLEVTIVSTAIGRRPFERESWEGGVKVTRVRAWPPNRDYYLAPALFRVIRQNRTDLIHCQGYHTLVAPVVMLAARVNKIPYLVTLHSGGHSSPLRRLFRPLQAWLLRPLLVRARKLIAVSEYEADLFARRLRLPRSAFVVIPSGVDLPEITPRPRSGPPLIVSIGRLERYKGHHRVIAALPRISRARPGARLRVAGEGPYGARLRAEAARHGVEGLVEIAAVPAADRREMAELLQRADVVTMLSRYESQGLAVQEALALGRPLLISDTSALGGLTEYPNVAAVSGRASADEIAEAILGLLDAPSAERPELPSWDECAASLHDLYLKTLAAGA
jgi:glycosyltransferase involved in cell wall biosynthesis